MVRFTVELLGDQKFVRVFSGAGMEVDNFEEAFGLIYEDFTAVNLVNFKAEGLPRPWVPLSERYAKWKQKHHPGLPIMVLKGALRDSLAGPSGMSGMGEGAIREIGPHDAYFGSNLSYAARQQWGYDGTPARPPVQLTTTDFNRWANIIMLWIRGKLHAATVAGGQEGV